MKVIVLDGNALGHREKYSMKGLSYDDMETGVIFGFMNELLRLAKMFETNKFVIAWDSKNSIRKEMYSPYKHKRKERVKTPEDKLLDDLAYKQFTMLRKEVLPNFGFKNVVVMNGYEGDDIIANIVLNNNDMDMVIASNDEDMFQLLNHAPIYSLSKKKVYSKDNFIKDYGIFPNKWARVKAIAGCSTDSVEGIKNVGEKTAIKYLNDKLKKESKAYKAIITSKESIKRNIALVKLPLVVDGKEMKTIPISFRGEVFTLDAFHILCDTYGFSSMKKNTNEWVKAFMMK